MIVYTEQVARIKAKLEQASKTDSKFEVFGASSHKYILNDCLSNDEIEKFEKKYNFRLPLCYKSFLLEIGNGGPSFGGSAAGPFYGIYPLGGNINELLENPEKSLGLKAMITPGVSQEEWEQLKSRLEDDKISDEEYEQEIDRLYAGVMPLGSQGCTYLHALIVTGEYAGKVVNIDLDFNSPRFCFEKNFLDWYERWLDEVISGALLADSPSWFGYTMEGNAKELLSVYETEADPKIKYEALSAMVKLQDADESVCTKLLNICFDSDKKLAHLAAQLLTKFSYLQAKSVLANMIEENDLECLAACQGIFWYQRKHAQEWQGKLRNRLRRVENNETFNFITYIIEECDIDYGSDLLPFLKHSNLKIRVQSYYLLGKLKDKRNYLNQFKEGLSDEASLVVHATLQALEGVKDKSLLKDYFDVLKRYPKEKDYVLVNLGHRLKDQGFSSRSEFARKYDPESDQIINTTTIVSSKIKRIFNNFKNK